jgi:hypothetical protein
MGQREIYIVYSVDNRQSVFIKVARYWVKVEKYRGKVSIPAFCQTGNPSGISDLPGAFATIGGMVSLTLLFTGWIKTTLEFTGKWARWLSWAVAMLLSFTGGCLIWGSLNRSPGV